MTTRIGVAHTGISARRSVPAPCGDSNLEPPVERGDAVGEPAQARSARRDRRRRRRRRRPPRPRGRCARATRHAWPASPARTWRRWSAPRRPRSRRRPRPARAAAPSGSRELDGHRRAPGERLERRAEPAVGEHGGWMPRASSRSSASASVSSSCAPVEQLARRRPGRVRSLLWASAHGQRERDEPLLGAVVQVALEPAALGRAGLDDSRARGAQLLDPGAQLRLQALVLDREAGRGGDGARPARGRRTARGRARSRRRAGPRARPPSRQRRGSSSAGSDAGGRRRRPSAPCRRASRATLRASGRRARRRAASRRLPLAARLAEPLEQVRDGAGADEARAHDAEQEHVRRRRRRRAGRAAPTTSSTACGPPTACGRERAGQQHQQRDAGPQRRAPSRCRAARGGPPARAAGRRST